MRPVQLVTISAAELKAIIVEALAEASQSQARQEVAGARALSLVAAAKGGSSPQVRTAGRRRIRCNSYDTLWQQMDHPRLRCGALGPRWKAGRAVKVKSINEEVEGFSLGFGNTHRSAA